MIDVNETNFERDVLGASTPVVVAFLSTRSEPSEATEPVLESVADL